MMRYIAVFLCGLLFAAAVAAEDGYRATYKLVVGALTVGKMERSYNLQADGAYRFESKLWSTGLVSIVRKDKLLETSTGTFQAGSYYPDNYTYIRQNKKKPRDIRMHFDRKSAEVKTVVNGDTLSSQLREGLLDKLVYQAALMHDLRTGKTEFNYWIADRGKEKTYQPVIGEQAVIETKLGRFDTFKIIRQSGSSKRRTTFWCAADLDYLPVRVTYRDKRGTETTALLTSFSRL